MSAYQAALRTAVQEWNAGYEMEILRTAGAPRKTFLFFDTETTGHPPVESSRPFVRICMLSAALKVRSCALFAIRFDIQTVRA